MATWPSEFFAFLNGLQRENFAPKIRCLLFGDRFPFNWAWKPLGDGGQAGLGTQM